MGCWGGGGRRSGCDVRQTWAVSSNITVAETCSPDLRFPIQWQRLLAAPMLGSCFPLGKMALIRPCDLQ